ncbi:MAG: hypothetical protein IKR85_07255 [Clostridia bacterium]|nr:hypothetical protein [Clostridia bacterium]
MEVLDNAQKFENYRAQMGRLTHAINAHFYLEALFIEYAIMEDRLESILTHAGVFREDKHNTITKKLRRLETLCQSDKAAKKYFSPELLQSILDWKENRNKFIHALMKQVFTGEELKEIVDQGQEIVKTLNNKSSCYKRALERQKEIEKND